MSDTDITEQILSHELLSKGLVGEWIMHLPTQVIGQVTAAMAPGEYQPDDLPEGASPPDAWTLRLAEGHVFVVDPEAFEILTPEEATFYAGTVGAVRTALEGAARLAMSRSFPMGRCVLFLRCALSDALRGLQHR